ncbi:hypothetical protein RUM44_011985 [Polyplax serrata]|uniref:Uncharacterized protein n=1 Tax=Polyplax serrata TaxID=468196 RepID=A0ABR1BE34_POLSC
MVSDQPQGGLRQLQYLKTLPRERRQDTPITEENYIEAWNLLERDLTTIEKLPPCWQIVFSNLAIHYIILNQFNEARQSILSVIKKEGLWDVVIYTNILNHLSEGICNCWKLSQGTSEVPKLELINFRKMRSRVRPECKGKKAKESPKLQPQEMICSVKSTGKKNTGENLPPNLKNVIKYYYMKIEAIDPGQFAEVFPHKKLKV